MLFLSIFGILLSIIFFIFNAKYYKSAIYLAGFFILISLYNLVTFILLYSGSKFWVSLAYIHPTFSFYLIGPLLYIYIRSILTDDPRLKKTDAWHLIPAIIFLLTAVPYIFSPYAIKMRYAEMLVQNIDYLGEIKPTILFQFLPAEFIFLSRAISLFLYALVSILLVARYIRTGRLQQTFWGQKFMIKWLSVLLGFVFLLIISHIYVLTLSAIVKNSNLFHTFNILQVASFTGLTGLLISPLFFPSILYGLPRILSTQAKTVDERRPIPFDNQDDKRTKVPFFELDYLEQIGNKIEVVFAQSQPYLQQEFSMAQLATLTHIPLHHLAYFFREHNGDSFHNFRNRWRVEYSKKLIREGQSRRLTLEAIGQSSGFSSRNTFFVAFKRLEGISPRDYAQRSAKIH